MITCQIGINSRISQQQGNHRLVALLTGHEEGSGMFPRGQVGIDPWMIEEIFHDGKVALSHAL